LIVSLAGGILLSAEQQVFFVISWLAVLILLQISVYPSLKRTFGSFAFPAAFPASVLVFTLISWYCGLVRLPIHLALIPFLALFAYHVYKKDYSLAELKSVWHWEALFLIAFFFMLDIRFANPTISYAEKFMDHGFLASVIRSPVVPPLDPWFSGGSLNVYYYLGYWMLGCLAIVAGVPSNIAFNLCLPTVFALSAVSLYAIGTLLLDRFRWLPLVTLILPNPALIFQILTGKAVNPAYDASLSWLGTRTITNTINEFPLFSFVWGDVHAHVVSIFNQVFLLFLLLFVYKRWVTLERPGKITVMALIAVSLGSMPLFNTWDVLLYAPLVLVTGFLILWRDRAFPDRTAWTFLLAVPPVSILCYLPFYLQLKTSTGAIALVRTPSDPLEFLWVNGIFIAIFFALLVPEIQKKPWLLLACLPFALAGYVSAAIAVIPLVYFIAKDDRDIPHVLAAFGLAILIACELIYMKDNMGETYFRMNTVFKCYLPAWLMLGTAAFVMAGQWCASTLRIPPVPARISAVLTVVVVTILFILPFVVIAPFSNAPGTLDGLAFLETQHPADAGGVAYLRSLAGSEILVEAEKGDYSYYSRISSFTGIPAVIGQPFHEFMWRGDKDGWFSTRNTDIRTIYEQPKETIPLMKKYNATLLYVGDPERERYNVTLPAAGLTKIYSSRGTDIYRLAG
jgi:YYY domain-containing protein